MTGVVTVRLKGGVGNQLFIYFAGAYLARRLNFTLELDLTELKMAKQSRDFALTKFNLPFPFETKTSLMRVLPHNLGRVARGLRFILEKLRGVKVITPKSIAYVDLDKISTSVVLDGYFQSYRYFKYLLCDNPNSEILVRSDNKLVDDLVELSQNAIVVHVRRGDFLNLRNSVGVLSKTYYLNAIRVAKVLHPDTRIILLGDDLEYLSLLSNNFKDTLVPELDNQIELQNILRIISSAKCIVSSNSTFSWWGSFLSENSTLIFPKQWHRNMENPDIYFNPSIILLDSDWE